MHGNMNVNVMQFLAYSLFWNVTQRKLEITDVSGQLTCEDGTGSLTGFVCK